jgi:transposase
MAVNSCPSCLEKQRQIDRLMEENQRLKQKLRYQQRKAQEGFFGSSTPSSQLPVKSNTPEKSEPKPRGARPGHKGAGRSSLGQASGRRVVEVQAQCSCCPRCGGPLLDKGHEDRSVLESPPVKAQPLLYRLPKKYCPRCRRIYKPKAPGVLPRSLYGNQLMANALVMHYVHGLPMGRICQQTGLRPGSLMAIFHRLARLFDSVPHRLIKQYRAAPAKHADETGWRMKGKNGYVWLFATPCISIFQFGKTRSAKVPQAVFGKDPTPGVLVVDRYSAYNKLPCPIQYCYAHLLREIKELEKEFPGEAEIQSFVATTAPLLSLAMGLAAEPIPDEKFYSQAAALKSQIKAAMERPARHLAIRRIQEIFRNNEGRLYHWRDDRRIPAHNNLAERDLRPSVIARKVSFGSLSEKGAYTRSVLTTVATTLKKRGINVAERIKHVLDTLAMDITQDPFPLLFPEPDP